MGDIFVFGSNLAGRHGKGSALEAARNHGALPGVGYGPTGDAYAIPTKDGYLRILPIESIAYYVRLFLWYANTNREHTFNVVAIGCGLAGYTPEQIAPLFATAGDNVNLPPEFLKVLGRG